MPDAMQPAPLPSVYQLRVVVHGVSPLIWRRLLIPADTTIAGLHAVLQIAFGWTGTHLHRFVVQGREYGIGYVGGPSFGDDPRRVRLGDLGLRRTERFTYHYDFTAGWCLDLRVEQILGAERGRPLPVCTGGRRAGPPEDCGGVRAFLESTQPHPSWRRHPCGRDPGHAPGRRGRPPVRRAPRRTRRPAPAARRGAFRPADAEPGPGSTRRGRDQSGMKVTVQVVLHADDDTQTAVREAFTLTRGGAGAGHPGVCSCRRPRTCSPRCRDTLVEHQVNTALSSVVACPDCGIPRPHKDSRRIVMRTLFGTLRLDSPRWWACPCAPRSARTFSPLAAVLRERTTPELSYLQARFAGLVSYGLSADMLSEILPLGRALHATTVRRQSAASPRNAWKTSSATSNRASSPAAPPTGRNYRARTYRWSSDWTAATSTPARSGPAETAGSK